MHIRLLAAALLAAFPLASFAEDATPPPAVPAPPSAAAAPAAQSVILRYKFAPGQTRRYKMTMTMTGTMLTGQSGAGIPLNTTMIMTMRQIVKDVRASDGAATIETHLENTQMSMNGKAMPLSPQQQAQMQQTFTSVMLPTGKVLSFQMPAMPTGGIPGMDMSKGLNFSSISFPDGPVKTGDTWNSPASAAMVGMQMLMTSTLAGVDAAKGMRLAAITQKITGNINMTLSKGMPMTMKMIGTLTGTGTQNFDLDAGAIADQTTDINTAMTMTFIPPAGGIALPGMPQSMKMAMKQTVTMERIADAAPTLAPVQ